MVWSPSTKRFSSSGPGQIPKKSRESDQGELYLQAANLPAQTLCLGIVARASGFVAHPGGSAGNLCLSGAIDRFIVQASGSDSQGIYEWVVDKARVPGASGYFSIQPGETLRPQLWYRDQAAGGAATSNFNPSASVTFE